MYDIVFIGSKNTQEWQELKHKFPTAKQADTFVSAQKKVFTNMFWVVYPDITLSNDWDFSYEIPEWDEKYTHVFLNGDTFDGVALHNKKYQPATKELEFRFYTNKKEVSIIASYPKPYDRFVISDYEDYSKALESTNTDMFWIIFNDVEIIDSSLFNLRYPYGAEYDYERNINHNFLHDNNGELLRNSIWLCCKHIPLTKKEVDYRFITNAKEHDIIASYPKPYDRFVISDYEDYSKALASTTTDMFWVSFSDVEIIDSSVFDLHYPKRNAYDTEYDYERNINHNFLHDNDGELLRNSIWLCCKHIPLTKKEVDYRFITNAKEHDIIASKRKEYDRFVISDYEDYSNALESTNTDMFWIIFNDVEPKKDFKFDIHYPKRNAYDTEYDYERTVNHTFIHDDTDKTRSGVWLCCKHIPLTKKEVDYRFITNAKEHDIIASYPKPYDRFVISDYEDYSKALASTTTDMFWVSFSNVEPKKDFNFDIRYTKRNAYDTEYDYERNINHNFLHDNDGELLRNGVWLCCKHIPLTKKEVDYRFITNAKEHDIIASKRKEYDRFVISDYEDYSKALASTTTDMFWVSFSDVEIVNSTVFNLHYPKRNAYDTEYDYERTVNHTFIHDDTDKTRSGVWLCSKQVPLTMKEVKNRFVVNAKEHDIIASEPKPFDIVFISYNESNADKNWQKLNTRFPRAKRVHGIEGIHQSHIEAAKLCTTDMFWVVDGDAVVLDSFNFDYSVSIWDRDVVHVWRSQNPITGLEYGYGGVKLLPRKLTINVDTTSRDMTTSISSKFKVVPYVSNITYFNTDAFSTWRSAFRESLKLTLNNDVESISRLEAWLHPISDAEFNRDAKRGAELGREYALTHLNDEDALNKINNFNWLKEYYESRY